MEPDGRWTDRPMEDDVVVRPNGRRIIPRHRGPTQSYPTTIPVKIASDDSDEDRLSDVAPHHGSVFRDPAV